MAYIFRKEAFSSLSGNYSMKDINNWYNETINEDIDKINGFLYFVNSRLVRDGNNFIIISANTDIFINTPETKTIDREYVRSISSGTLDNINDGNYGSAITKSRTLP